jgi:PAS domain S-box-containing protein
MDKARIGIVEDEAILAEDLARRLALFGHSVVGIVDTGAKAIQLALDVDPDLMLIDITLKGEMDGIDAAAEMRKRGRPPFVFMTAHSDAATIGRAKQTEPFGYLLKPVEDRELLSTIEISLHRSHMERELKENRRWLATVLGSIGDGVISVDLAGNVTYLNHVAEKLTGWSSDAAMQQPLREVLCIVDSQMRRDDGSEFYKATRECRAIGPLNLLLRDCRRHVPVRIAMTVDSLKRENDTSEGVVLVFRDVTQQFMTLRELELQKRHFQALFDQSPDAIVVLDHEDTVINVNGRFKEMFQYSPDEVIGRNLWELIVPREDHGQALGISQTVLEDGRVETEAVRRRKDGSLIMVSIVGSRISGDDEHGLVYVVYRDITEERKAMARLRQLSRAVDQSPVSIVITDTDGTIEYINPKFTQVTGYTRAEAIGQNPRILKGGGTTDGEYRSLWTAIRAGNQWSGELHNKRKDGTLFWEDARISPVLDESGNIASFIAVKEDITEKKRAHEAFVASIEEFQRVWDSSLVGMRIVDEQGITLRVNNAYCRMTGKKAEELVGKHYAVIYGPSYHAKVKASPMDRLNPQELRAHFEKLLELWDGRQLWFEVTNSPLQIEGRPPTVLSIFRDISIRKQAEARLEESQQRIQQIVESVGEGITLGDPSGRMEIFNSTMRELTGYSMEEANTTTDFAGHIIVDPADRQRFTSQVEILLAGGTSCEIEASIRSKTGEIRRVLISRSLFMSHSQSFILSSYRDITNRVLMERQLQGRNVDLENSLQSLRKMQATLVHSEKMASIGQLTAGIAHEINNPLAFVSSNINRFKEYFEDAVGLAQAWSQFGSRVECDAVYDESLAALRAAEESVDMDFIINDFNTLMRHTREGADRIRNIVEQLRGFSHVGGTTFAEASINQALDDTVTIAWNELKYKATIRREYSELPPVQCNVSELKQVFVNLLVNAAHAIDKQGTITITTRHEGEHVLVAIADTGCGIPHDKLNRIFDPFFTTKPVGKGTGLGLWVVTSILNKHRGSVTVQSEVGKGTAFTLRIPVSAVPREGDETCATTMSA